MFGIDIKKKRFYTFMDSTTLLGRNDGKRSRDLIDSPATDGCILVGLDDCINPKAGKIIFASETIFDHAAKAKGEIVSFQIKLDG